MLTDTHRHSHLVAALQKLNEFTAAHADTAATIVVIGGVTDFHQACAAASNANLCVERVYSNIAPMSIVGASSADWQCSLADWLYAVDLQGPPSHTCRKSDKHLLAPALIM